jgi:hypothetical protein
MNLDHLLEFFAALTLLAVGILVILSVGRSTASRPLNTGDNLASVFGIVVALIGLVRIGLLAWGW